MDGINELTKNLKNKEITEKCFVYPKGISKHIDGGKA